MKQLAMLLCVGTCLLSALVGSVAWLSTINPHQAMLWWSVRIATAILFPGSLIVIILVAMKPEPVPDFLSKLRNPRIGRGSVLFVFDCVERDGWAWLEIHYQNRYNQPAHIGVGVQPSKNFLMSRNDIDPVVVQFYCGKAAYGIIHVPIAVKRDYQGQKQKFDVASCSDYPNDMGESLRNVVGQEMSPLDPTVLDSAAFRLARMALTGALAMPITQSRVTVRLPMGVAESADRMPPITQDEQWTLEDQVTPS